MLAISFQQLSKANPQETSPYPGCPTHHPRPIYLHKTMAGLFLLLFFWAWTDVSGGWFASRLFCVIEP